MLWQTIERADHLIKSKQVNARSNNDSVYIWEEATIVNYVDFCYFNDRHRRIIHESNGWNKGEIKWRRQR